MSRKGSGLSSLRNEERNCRPLGDDESPDAAALSDAARAAEYKAHDDARRSGGDAAAPVLLSLAPGPDAAREFVFEVRNDDVSHEDVVS